MPVIFPLRECSLFIVLIKDAAPKAPIWWHAAPPSYTCLAHMSPARTQRRACIRARTYGTVNTSVGPTPWARWRVPLRPQNERSVTQRAPVPRELMRCAPPMLAFCLVVCHFGMCVRVHACMRCAQQHASSFGRQALAGGLRIRGDDVEFPGLAAWCGWRRVR